MANQCKHCGKALSSASTFCGACGTLIDADGVDSTVIVRVPQPDGQSPWAKLGSRYQQPTSASDQVQGKPLNQHTPRLVIDLVSQQESAHPDVNPVADTTRIIGRAKGAFSLRGWLVALTGPRTGESWVIRSGKSLIGRDPGLAVTLNEDAVSSIHAALWIDSEVGTTLVDRDSSNGTFVNGEQIFSSVRLADGDLVRVGESTILQWVLFHAAAVSYTHLTLPTNREG